MTTRFAFKHGSDENRENTRQAIRERQPFVTGGSFFGADDHDNPGRLKGAERTAFYAQYSEIDYVVVSWDTPIAWHTPQNGWHIVDQVFSQSTSRQQSFLKAAIGTERVSHDTH